MGSKEIAFTEHLLHARHCGSTSLLILTMTLKVGTIITSILQRKKLRK